MKLSLIALTAILLSTPTLASAERYGGSRLHYDRVEAYSNDIYTEPFTRGSAHIEVRGNGTTDLDCFVTDGLGNTVAQDTDETDYCILDFYVISGGNFRIVVQNLGDHSVPYWILAR